MSNVLFRKQEIARTPLAMSSALLNGCIALGASIGWDQVVIGKDGSPLKVIGPEHRSLSWEASISSFRVELVPLSATSMRLFFILSYVMLTHCFQV